jgi:hypothetical protein
MAVEPAGEVQLEQRHLHRPARRAGQANDLVHRHRRRAALFIDGDLPRVAPERLRAVGAAKTLLATPAIANGEVVAMVEIVDASEANAAVVEKAVAHAASQLAAFLVAKK